MGGAAVGRSYYRILPYPPVRIFLGRGLCRLAWWAGGIPSRGLHAPLVLPVGAESRAKALHPLGDDAGNVGHRRCGSIPASGSDGRIARNPRTVQGWRHLCTPCCSMGVTIRWLRGLKQPSRLHSATDRLGLPARQALLLRQLGLPLRGVWALTSSELPWAVPDGPT